MRQRSRWIETKLTKTRPRFLWQPLHWASFPKTNWRGFLANGYPWGFVLLGAIAALVLSGTAGWTDAVSSYSLGQQAAFNQPSHYPVATNSELNNRDTPYHPVAEWMGRLILPDAPIDGDWVWMEVYHAPARSQALVGQTVRLEWGDGAFPESYPSLVTTDVELSQAARQFQALGNVIPTRLDGRSQVGPLQSLAGSRPNDDLEVRLTQVTLTANAAGNPVLQTELEPVQITGRWYGLVDILEPDATRPAPAVCPGDDPCPSEFFRVHHYNAVTGTFDGTEDVIRIPQQPRDRNGRFFSTPHQLEESVAGEAGWYVYGAYDADGMFTVQALEPRSLHRLQPQRVILGKRRGHNYITQRNWRDTPERKGTLQSVLIDPIHSTAEEAIADWQEGDMALLIHLFGGIGGENGEGSSGWMVTGHYAYGIAEVIREPITGELQFDVLYQQVYANNPNGIVSGSLDWSAYTGDLQRGWLGNRPISDVIVKFDALARPFQFGDKTVSVSILRELGLQTQILAARYRTGDGNGLAAVTPATSCVQDSSQALYIALTRLQQAILTDEALVAWLREHPNDPEVQRFERVVELGNNLNAFLVPRGTVRPDWEQNAEFLAGISGEGSLGNQPTLENALLSWRSIMPRQAHDEVSRILLRAGAQLWFLRTNQVGGFDPSIEPIAPTKVLGQLPIISLVANRLLNATLTPIGEREWAIFLAILGIYTAIALPFGFQSHFLIVTRHPPFPWWKTLLTVVRLFFLPALFEETLRVILLPHPSEGVSILFWTAWAIISLALYVAYHPINARTFYRAGYPTFTRLPFLVLCTLLGLACTLLYGLTGSLLALVLFHWLVVVFWLFSLGGFGKLGDTDKSLSTAK
ncbi:CPBP family intramembrane metalloprotease [filamentous cyanobacterium LEGE 07170]|nr:CPBP family intramembrane metalloprotease [filamentous cyanobacterium LEGE 07170]